MRRYEVTRRAKCFKIKHEAKELVGVYQLHRPWINLVASQTGSDTQQREKNYYKAMNHSFLFKFFLVQEWTKELAIHLQLMSSFDQSPLLPLSWSRLASPPFAFQQNSILRQNGTKPNWKSRTIVYHWRICTKNLFLPWGILMNNVPQYGSSNITEALLID